MCYIGGLLHDVLAVEEIVGYAIIMGSKRIISWVCRFSGRGYHVSNAAYYSHWMYCKCNAGLL